MNSDLYPLYFKMLLGDKRAKPRISMDGVYAEQRQERCQYEPTSSR